MPGRPFVKGDPRAGRKKGSKNRTPASVKALLEQLARERPELYERAIRRGLAARGARSYAFVALAAHYLDGKPIERVCVQADARLLFVPASPGSASPVVPDLGELDLDEPSPGGRLTPA